MSGRNTTRRGLTDENRGDENTLAIIELRQSVTRLKWMFQQLLNSQTNHHRKRNQHRQDRLIRMTDVEDTDSENSKQEEARDGHIRNNQYRTNYRIRADIPLYHGRMKIEDLLDWISDVERFFEFTEVAEHMHLKLVAYKLRSVVDVWLDKLQMDRR